MISYAPALSSIDAAILKVIAGSRRPIGQGAINLRLRKQGILVSAPTVGRKLQELEANGLVRKVSVEGRVLTDRGSAVLIRYDAEARLRLSGDALLNTLRRGDRRHLLDLLCARRVIEGETAALAAVHASPQAIGRMDELLDRQAESIRRGEMGLTEDVAFHLEVARASRNEVLNSLAALLRQHRRYDLLMTSMRAAVGGRLVVDHRAILAGIRAHDPGAARRAMEDHLRKLADDLDRYWNRLRGREFDADEGEAEPPSAD